MANSSLPKTYAADCRYGSTFLDLDAVEQSVRGEVLTDRDTGELYSRRYSDGKIISFAQKSMTIYEAIKEFNIQYQAAEGFKFPTDPGAFMVGLRFSVDEFTPRANKKDILKENIPFNVSSGDKSFRFETSCKTNGVFIKPVIRFGDRNACAFLAGKFFTDEVVDFGSNAKDMEQWMDLSPLYPDVYDYTLWKKKASWVYSAAMVDYTVKTTGESESQRSLVTNTSNSVPIRLSEYSFLPMPEGYDEGMKVVSNVEVSINKLYFPKLQYERYVETQVGAPNNITEVLGRLIEPDIRAVLNSVDMFYFIDAEAQIPMSQNFSINHLVNIEMLLQAVDDLSNSTGTRAVQAEVERPIAWQVDTLWCEIERILTGAGTMQPTASKTRPHEVEKALYSTSDAWLEFVTDQWNLENAWVERTGV